MFGAIADQPIAGDWDGTDLWEVGVLKAGSSTFRAARCRRHGDEGACSATADDLPVTGDWDGDKRTDLGVYDRDDRAPSRCGSWTATGLAWTAQIPFGDRRATCP